MQWASTYFVEVKGISTERAATFAALFYIGITSGRFASGFITDKLGDQKMIRLGTGILICGILVLFLPIASYQAAFAAFLVIGFGCAPIYPCIIHSTPVQFWSRELRCDHRHSDGERIHWNDVYPADFRYPWKFHRIFHPAAISAGVRGADDYDG